MELKFRFESRAEHCHSDSLYIHEINSFQNSECHRVRRQTVRSVLKIGSWKLCYRKKKKYTMFEYGTLRIKHLWAGLSKIERWFDSTKGARFNANSMFHYPERALAFETSGIGTRLRCPYGVSSDEISVFECRFPVPFSAYLCPWIWVSGRFGTPFKRFRTFKHAKEGTVLGNWEPEI